MIPIEISKTSYLYQKCLINRYFLNRCETAKVNQRLTQDITYIYEILGKSWGCLSLLRMVNVWIPTV